MATSNAALIASIRFQLNQLSSANGHHAFEHLARHLARARVYSNILPATGPVGAGGDGGRDFQTFRVVLNPAFTKDSKYAQNTSGDRIVAFACSLEVKIEPKIRADVKTILADGPADEVVYFCEANLAIGKRRKLQKWAKALGVELIIFDGAAISEMLVDPEVFWIAQEFLSLAADLIPPRTAEPDWYEALRARWRNRPAMPVSQADFFEVKAGVRHATFEAEARPDLRFWLEKMAVFAHEPAPRPLIRSALYELAVANLRGRNEMTSQLKGLREYYSDCADYVGLADLMDAAILLVYAFTGALAGHLDTDAETLFGWRAQLDGVLEAEIARAPGPGRKSGLLRVRGHLGLLPPTADSVADPTAAYADWHLMLDVAKDAPLFPIESFSDFLISALKWGIDQEHLLELAARADEMLAERGGAAAAEKALARAQALLETDQITAAIGALHIAKKRWFSGDYLKELLRSFLVLANSYHQLRLPYAAKYYAFAAAYMADHEQGEAIVRLLPEALHVAIDAEDAAGNSFGFFMLLLHAVGAHFRLRPDPLDQNLHPWINANLSHLAALLGLLRRGQPTLEAALAEPLALWPEPLRQGFLEIVDSPEAVWNQGSWDDLWTLFQDALADRPFGDLGPRRHVRWEALGLTWTAIFDNTYAVTPVAEEFLAALQITLASHAGRDLGLAPSETTLDIVVDAGVDETTVNLNRGAAGGPRFTVTLPAKDRDQEAVGDTLTAIFTILRMHSVLDNATFLTRVRPDAMEEVFVARPYAEMWRHFVEEPFFFETVRQGAAAFRPDLAWPTQGHEELAAFSGPGPTYDETEAVASIEKRYRVILPILKHTLPRLLAEAAVFERLRAMHDEGLRDWEILAILSNVAMNLKLKFADDTPTEAMMARGQAFFEQEEQPHEALDPADVTDEMIDLCRKLFIGAHLDSWRLPAPPAATIAGLQRLLRDRYRMRDLDIEHDDVFGWGKPTERPECGHPQCSR